MEPVLYLQTDPKWANKKYAVKDEGTTIKTSGCGPTCAAMVIASLVDPSVTPATTAKWAMKHNFKAYHQGTYYSYFEKQFNQYKILSKQLNLVNIYKASSKYAKECHEEALKAIKRGDWVICCMGKGNWTSGGHYILWYGLTGNGQAMIRDPYSTRSNRVANKVGLLQEQVKYYWVVATKLTAKPNDFEEDDEVIEKRKVDIFGKEYETDVIFKENRNFVSPKVFADAGLKVSSKGNVPVISESEVKVVLDGATHDVPGHITNGKTYCGLRDICQLLGLDVSYEDGEIHIVVPKE